MNSAARQELRHIRYDDRGSGEENHGILQEGCGTMSLRTVKRQRVAETKLLAYLARMLG